MENDKETRDAVARATGSGQSLNSDSPFDSAAEMLAVAMSYWSVQYNSATPDGYWWMNENVNPEPQIEVV